MPLFREAATAIKSIRRSTVMAALELRSEVWQTGGWSRRPNDMAAPEMDNATAPESRLKGKTMKPVDPAKANADVRAVFDDIKAARGVDDVNNFWKYMANEPRMLRHTWESLKDIMGPGALDPLTKELIYVAISVSNNCNYCMASHTAAARAKGATDAQLNELYAVVGLANMTNRLANAYKVPVDDAFKESD
ncbi:MAG: carboxymuconolactone decarboxylase family protein [Hyphomicrobiaceae bacterium]